MHLHELHLLYKSFSELPPVFSESRYHVSLHLLPQINLTSVSQLESLLVFYFVAVLYV